MDNIRVGVYVREGKLIGIVEKGAYGGNYIAFRGIPYAKPPIGELRFKDPVPPELWSGDRDASKYGNIAVQMDILTRKMVGDEDCLYLNVYTTDVESEDKRPVMIWIHGGGFGSGSGDSTLFGPDHIIRKDVILVTLNYRLGALGFLNLYHEVATGNQALKDVLMALQWVQKNISKFGGDPENVTVFGGSAGGILAHYLALSPLTKGLIHKVISQSSVATSPWAFTDPEPPLKNKGFQLAEKLGKVTTDPKVAYEFLKTVDAKKLRLAEHKDLLTETERRQILIPFTPSLDNESPNPFFSEHPTMLIQRGVKMPFLLGYNSFEGIYFIGFDQQKITSEESLKLVDSDFKKAIYPRTLSNLPQIPITVEELRFLYFGNKAVSKETLINYANFLGDEAFHQGIMEVADIQINCGSYTTTYMYKFSYESKNSLIKKILNFKFPDVAGVSHAEEMAYLFYPHIIKDLGLLPPAPDSEDYKMINRLVQMWTDFAKTGDPTPAITDLTPIKWTPLKCGSLYHYLNINIESRMQNLRKGYQRWDWKNMKNKL